MEMYSFTKIRLWDGQLRDLKEEAKHDPGGK